MTSTDIGYLLNRATRQFRLGFANRLMETGRRPQQAAALMAIGRSAERPMTPSQLADAIDMDAATTSGLLDRLVRDGWVESTRNPEDGRSRLVVLTPKAADALPAVVHTAATVSEAATACLSADEARTLEVLLSRLCEHAAGSPSKRGDQ
jgi:DNA-binding MarR family transcriptional regulator